MDKIEASVVFQRYEQALAGRSPYAWLRKLNCVGFDLAIPDGAEGRNIPGRRQAYDNSSSIVRRFLKIAKNVGR
jgi:hypothetical protein